MPLDADTLWISRDRIRRVFRYLEALNQHRNPATRQIREQPWVLWLRDLPDHPAILRGSFEEPTGQGRAVETASSTEPRREANDFVLKVRRPTLTRAPNPPDAIVVWLERGWEDPAGQVRVRESLNETDDRGETEVVRFDADPQRLRALETWRARRDEWARNERPAREAMKIFEQLYELHSRIEREAERVELVLGDGILSWRRPEGGVYHPVLLQRLQLEFHPGVPDFTVVETEHEVELYSALFRSMSEVDGRAIARCREELDQGVCHPLGDDATSGFLRSFVVRLSPRGEFIGQGAPVGESDDPRVGRDPVLFLRARTLGFATAIEAVLENIEDREDMPRSLLNVVGVEPLVEETEDDAPTEKPWSDPEEILLSKPTNPEQVRIAERLERRGSVLVQGPPGTGKTHTIANLIGHLLAKGESVLVTAHTTKALRVLRDYVVEQLRPLCVSVLESDIESRKQLESSVEAIVERLSTSDARQLEAETDRLATQRRELLEKLRKLRQDLLDTRATEYRDVIVAGQGYSPSEAARKVDQEKGRNDWIPGPVTPGAPLPLSGGELTDLYRTNVTVTCEDEIELSAALPKPDEIPTPEELDRLAEEHARLAGIDLTFRADLWNREPSTGRAGDLESLAERLRHAIAPLTEDPKWRLVAVMAGRTGGPHRETWDNLVSLINEVRNQAASVQEGLLRYAPTLSDQIPLEEQKRIVDEVIGHFESHRSLGRMTLLMHPGWKRFVRETRVGGGPPRTVEHFYALRDLVRLRNLRLQLAGRWDRQLANLGASASAEMGERVEDVCAQFIPLIIDCLDWHERVWEPLERELQNLSFRWDAFLGEQPPKISPYGDLLRLRDAVLDPLHKVLTARADAVRWCCLEGKLKALERTLNLTGGGERMARVADRLLEAVSRLEPAAYREAFQRLVDLQSRRTDLECRRALLRQLESVARAWAAAIRDRLGLHGGRDIPGDAVAAWLWRQLHDELERRSQASLHDMQQTVERLSADLRRVTAELVDRRAWASQVRRTTLQQRQALVGWLDTVRKIGKGTGKRVPRLRLEASRKMSECRSAVPVWIMPLTRVAENFDPRTTRFDVVIIDEASQCDAMALLAFYLARKVVVVGDHEQVSPSAVGQDLAIVQHLIDEHLQGIPNAVLYDGQMSIYDLARQSFGGTICLLEHFRCVPEIIQFSNHLSYDGRIRPLRDPSVVQLKPHVIAYRVSAASSESKVNQEEALTVASLVVAASEQPEYANKTFGVISLVGEEQAFEIDRLIRNHLPGEQYQRRRIICGNAAHFQGDERDIMFLSLVDTRKDWPLPLRDQQMFRQRFNVAASRARDQMWVVHSLDPRSDLKPGDLRRRLIEHAEDPSAAVRALEKAERRAESELERAVMRHLVQAGYRIHPQWQVGYYRIDLVVEGGGQRLAVECDGDRFHPIEKLGEDMARQAILERLGWTFVRIRGSEFFRDPDRALKSVFSRLASLGICPEGDSSDRRLETGQDSELRERIIRCAEELRRKWDESGNIRSASETAREPASTVLKPAEDLLTAPEPVKATSLPEATAKFEGALSSVSESASTARPASRDLLFESIGEHVAKDAWICPHCHEKRRLWIGRKGPFLQCGSPRCKRTESVVFAVLKLVLVGLNVRCETCGAPVRAASGKHGSFVGCSRYPECKKAISWKDLRGRLRGAQT